MAILRISPGAAALRTRAAAACGPRSTMVGEQLPPKLPVLAAAQRAGDVSPDQAGIIERAVTELSRPDIDPEMAVIAEQALTKDARTLGPRDLRLNARQIVDYADRDGPGPGPEPEPDDDENSQLRRTLKLQQLRDGMWGLEGRLTPDTGVQLSSLLGARAKPQTTRIDVDGTPRVQPDPRGYGQRMHDAWTRSADTCCAANTPPAPTRAALLRSVNRAAASRPGGGASVTRCPASAPVGAPANVVVHIDLDDLLQRTGHGHTSVGAPLNSAQLLRIAHEAVIWSVIHDANGVPLALGRTQRLASRGQSIALYARDGGCSFPSCDRPPEWCDRHHVLDWIKGGLTE